VAHDWQDVFDLGDRRPSAPAAGSREQAASEPEGGRRAGVISRLRENLRRSR
jgi:hypothetical protein